MEEFNEFYSNEDECPIAEMAMSLSMMDKPFGIIWDREKMERFLEHRGYQVITRYSDVTESEYRVAVRPDSSYIPERSNISELFVSEVQETILGWLMKL